MPSRDEVYAAINTERNYQDGRWTDSPDQGKGVSEWLIYIRSYYDDAVQCGTSGTDEDILGMVRKLAGLCVACMEINGGFHRWNDGSFSYRHLGIVRDTVYEMIDHERDYQNGLSSDRTDGSPHTINGYLVMFGHYLNQAFEKWTMNPGDDEALACVGKLAGIAVHCMEDHGAPLR
jgi:hypothetical protein